MTELTEARAFLWDRTHNLPNDSDFEPLNGEWWNQYYSILVKSGRLSESTLRELTRTSREISGLLPHPMDSTLPSPFKGVVVGAVQSGKTQSMMGVAATALDKGYKLVVVLAGLKDDLRTQTARRFNTDLLIQSDRIPGVMSGTTLGRAVGSYGNIKAYAPPYYTDCHDYSPLATELVRALRIGKPCLVVIKKHPASLNDLSLVLADVYKAFGPSNLPTLVLDDECDEATVPGGGDEKPIPDAIINLWGRVDPRPRVAYVGYTATAAANLLQHQDWDLYPHWSYLLRYPGKVDSAIEFLEPISDNWYTGGDCYFSDFGDEPAEDDNFLICTGVSAADLRQRVNQNQSLLDAVRAFFVSGAMRLALDPSRNFDDLRNLPEPHSMMIHTSSSQEDHSLWASGIREAFGGSDDGNVTNFSVEYLSALFNSEEPLWKAWYQKLVQSRERVYEARPHQGAYLHASWAQVKQRLPEVFQNTRLKVVNSDDSAGSLDYKAPLGLDGKPLKKPDIFLIAVGGSRLSRGITVEGLCISYFARWANTRHDDTVLQMSRWFGYRGRYLEFCRLFTTTSAFAGLRETSENDLHLRAQLAHLMKSRKSPKDATLVFMASPNARPTAKIGAGKIHDCTFSPYTRVLSNLDCGSQTKFNQDFAERLVASVKSRNFSIVHRNGGVQRGYLSQGWTALEIAEILENWTFEKHNPTNTNSLLGQFYRPHDATRAVCSAIDSRQDPYQIAAYLRYWVSTSSAMDTQQPPIFNVGVAFGEVEMFTEPFGYPLLNRTVTESDEAIGGWTGSSSNWRGDIIFDNPPPDQLDERMNRSEQCSGLLLLYVIHKSSEGKSGKGKARSHHTPFFGIAIPSGGPSFLRVTTSTGEPLVEH